RGQSQSAPGRGRDCVARTSACTRAQVQSWSAGARPGGDAALNQQFKKRRGRIGALTVVLAGFFVLVALRLAALVIFDGPRLTSLARTEHTGEIALAASRGPLVDRNGEPLALSAETRSIYARPAQLLASATHAQLLALAVALGLSPSEVGARLHRGAAFVWLRRHLPRERAHAVEAMGLEGVGALS